MQVRFLRLMKTSFHQFFETDRLLIPYFSNYSLIKTQIQLLGHFHSYSKDSISIKSLKSVY